MTVKQSCQLEIKKVFFIGFLEVRYDFEKSRQNFNRKQMIYHFLRNLLQIGYELFLRKGIS